ncbi:excisionase [Pontibacillus yanchengensis Y32]|uniref:Excisionase n=1 Tax=Pontibacillus yanchengensis Y32 TaxID=1385514 RepID=A0A0A2TGY3_9BACI|nr:excisionase [Pontibacillus yanchengensis Y32]
MQKESIDYNDLPTVLTAKEVGEILSISKPTAYKIMKMKGFPLLEIGRSKRTLKKEFFNWLSCSDRK